MARGFRTLPIEDFSGGWNPRDAWSQVADNESPECLNVTLDERGGVTKRLGLTKTGAQIVNTGNVVAMYYSQALDLLLAQVGTGLYKSSDGGSTWSASIKTFTTSAPVDMVDFLSKVVIIHPADNCFTYDGATVAGPIANSPDGTAIAVWQNFLWSVGDPANPKRVTRSDPAGSIAWNASPVFVDLRYKDDQPLSAIGGGVGMDEAGRGGLLVFKEDSTYRIHDASSMANTVMDYSYGASSARAIVTNRGVTAAISKKGIVTMRGDYGPTELVSDKLQPLFSPTQMTYANASNLCAGRVRDRMVFSLPWDGSAVNNLTLEYDPGQGWFVPSDFGATCFTSYLKNTDLLYGGKVGTGAATYGYVLKVFNGGTDDGANIPARFQTRWYAPFGNSSVRYRRVIVNGRGLFNLYVKLNYDTGQGNLHPIDITGTGSVWGNATWGIDTWGTDLLQDTQEVFSLGHGRAISFEVADNSGLTSNHPPLLDTGASEVQGAFALYGLTLDMVPLGAS